MFSFSLVSDLPSKVHSAIPSILQSHRLQLSVISAKCLLLFLIGLSLLVHIIMREFGFVNYFFSDNTVRREPACNSLAQPRKYLTVLLRRLLDDPSANSLTCVRSDRAPGLSLCSQNGQYFLTVGRDCCRLVPVYATGYAIDLVCRSSYSDKYPTVLSVADILRSPDLDPVSGCDSLLRIRFLINLHP